MKYYPTLYFVLTLLFAINLTGCGDEEEKPTQEEEPPESTAFVFGADLSYVNQILDHGGVYKVEGEVKNPYEIFKDNGTDLIRFRLWHTPNWTKDIYGDEGTQMYNDLADVEEGIRLAKEQGMKVLLDFHYSDTWADPGKQIVPKAWQGVKDLAILKDSVYQYTFKVLSHLNDKGLMPEMVQIGNEINCGMFFTDTKPGFPTCNACEGEWQQLGEVINSGIRAVREVSAISDIETQLVLHVADPKNVAWWFDNITSKGNVSDFDVIGFSYYPLWHTTVSLDKISESVSDFTDQYQRPVMILETAYPWTTDYNDNYTNQLGGQTPLQGYPFTQQGQYDFMVALTKEVMEGGGDGVIYWAPAWITSNMKDKWGTGSSWENCALFDFEGNVHQGFDYTTP